MSRISRRFHNLRYTMLGACVAVGAVWGLSGCPPPADEGPVRVVVSDNSVAQSHPLSPAQMAELARGEGELWWYTSMPEEAARQFLEVFHSKYPFLNTVLVRGGTFELAQRVSNELQQGRIQVDVLHVLDPATFVDLKKRGELLWYDSPQARSIPLEYRDTGFWVGMRLTTLCIAYDTRRMSRQDVPSRWEELLDPKFTGRIGLKDAQTAGSAYAQYYYLRERYGTAFWERLAARKPRIFKTAEDNIQALLDKQIDVIGGIMGYAVYHAVRAGKPIGIVWPEDGVPVILGPIAILKRAPHPNAGKLFVDFALSEEGQQAIRDLLGTYSVRPDVQPPAGRPPLSELKLIRPSDGWDEFATKQAQLRAEYTRLFHSEAE